MVSTFPQLDAICPNCTSTVMSAFYDLKQVPVHSVLLHASREEAVELQKGDISLALCPACGFISNVSFDPNLQNYLTHNYDATQAYSGTFNSFHRELALRLINKYDLRGKKIVEIGCGQGEFLDLLCSLSGSTGIGFDPAYVEGRYVATAKDRIKIIKDYYTEENSQQYGADFVCCKMTLEHIREPFDFVNMVAHSVRDLHDTIVFFQIPNAQYVLQEIAFWDIYYEHCSYFSQASLSTLFQLCGFQVLNLSFDYDNQYLMIEAKPSEFIGQPVEERSNELEKLQNDVMDFQSKISDVVDGWRDSIREFFLSGKKVVVWGGGSKAVSFLTTLKIQDEIEYVVDINPNKHGMYLAGTGQKIMSPEFLREYKPNVIIVMNPIYMSEIQNMLDKLDITCELLSVKSRFGNE